MAVVEAQSQHQHLLDELIADVEAYKPDVDRDLLQRAFAFAERAHEGQQRRSGEDFIHHPWGAAKILAGLHLDEQTLAAALLHDVVEDTETPLADVKSEFGDEIARLVEGVTKLTRIHFASRAWDGDASRSLRVQIAVNSWDRPRLLEDVARTFAEHTARTSPRTAAPSITSWPEIATRPSSAT